MNPPVSVVIPTYNGCHLLKKYLHKACSELKSYNKESEVIIVDNNSSDDTENYIKEIKQRFPGNVLIQNPENYFFSKACNIGVAGANHEIIVLLNNDMELGDNFFSPLINTLLQDENIFAVSPVITNAYKNANETISAGRILRGQLIIDWPALNDSSESFTEIRPILFACGGCMVFRKKDFDVLDGFDGDLFKPYYVEDLDLSYRAWKTGKKVLFTPESSLIHYTASSITNDIKNRNLNRSIISMRNFFIFFWKNITDTDLIIKHILWLPFLLCRACIRKEFSFVLSFFGALLYIPGILKYRWKQTGNKVSDKQIIAGLKIKN